MKVLIFTLVILFSVNATAEDYSVLYEKTSPSVVTIYVMTSDKGVISRGMGAGVVVSQDMIVTAAHVVKAAIAIKAVFTDGTTVDAIIVMIDDMTDIAVIRMADPKLDAALATLADSDKVKVGEPVYVIGSPMGHVGSLSAGHVSRLAEREISGLPDPLMYIQTGAAINTGNSGGGVFNAKGHVVGIVSFMLSKSGGSDGLGYAVASNIAKELIDLSVKPTES